MHLPLIYSLEQLAFQSMEVFAIDFDLMQPEAVVFLVAVAVVSDHLIHLHLRLH